jgi:hypothetical protein
MAKKHLRIRGPLCLVDQLGELYRSIGFTSDAAHPMPSFLLLGTEARTARPVSSQEVWVGRALFAGCLYLFCWSSRL